MKHSEWFDINESCVNIPHVEEVKGVRVHIKLSAFDVPEKASTMFDEETKQLIFQFDYGDFSESRKEIREANLVLSVGKKSKRLYEMKIDCSALIDKSINQLNANLFIEEAEHALSAKPKKYRWIRPQNYEATKNVLHKYKDSFANSLAM